MHFTRDRTFEAIAQRGWENYARLIPFALVAFITLVAFLAAGSSVSTWESILKFLHPTAFGTTDPIFERDIGFYIFRLPFWEGLQSWLFTLALWGLIVAIAVYALKSVIQLIQRPAYSGGQVLRQLPALLTGKIIAFLTLVRCDSSNF